MKLLQAQPPAVRTTLTLDELAAARADVSALDVPGTVLRAVADLRRELGRRGVVASDRRWAQSLGVLRARAWLEGRDTVHDGDVAFLEHVLWRDPAERQTVRDAIRELLHGHEDEVRVLLYQARELRDYALRDWEGPELRSAPASRRTPSCAPSSPRWMSCWRRHATAGVQRQVVEGLRQEIAAIQQELLAKL